jgi:hypothetical protein
VGGAGSETLGDDPGRRLRPTIPAGSSHTHATLALTAGIATRIVSDRLGHATTAITADVYQQAAPELERDAATRIAALVYPPATRTVDPPSVTPPHGRRKTAAETDRASNRPD